MKPRISSVLAGACGASFMLALYALIVERLRLQFDEYQVTLDKPGLPKGGLTILHLTDLHCRAQDPLMEVRLRRLRGRISATSYDVVAVTGDLIHSEAGLPVALAFLQTLKPRYGVYSCPGNHDYSESTTWGMVRAGVAGTAGRWAQLKLIVTNLVALSRKLFLNRATHHAVGYHDIHGIHDALRAIGIVPLVNSSTRLPIDGLDCWIAGVDDLWEGKPDPCGAVAAVPPDAPLVLLAHNPDAWLSPCAQQADLILSGHVHGGQIRLPFLGAIHTQGTHLTRQRPGGWFRTGTTRMFAGRGLGEGLPLRFGAPPQAVLIRLSSPPAPFGQPVLLGQPIDTLARSL